MRDEMFLRQQAVEFLSKMRGEGFSTIEAFTAVFEETKRICQISKPSVSQTQVVREEADTKSQPKVVTVPVVEAGEDLPEVDKETYLKLADELIRSKMGNKRCPRPEVLRKSIEILYIIHKDEYRDVDELCQMVSEAFNIDVLSARLHLVAGSMNALYAGIYAFVSRYLKDCTYGVWKASSVGQRLMWLEYGESILYREIVEKYERESVA